MQRLRPGWFEADGPMGFARWLVCYGFVAYGWLLFFHPVGTVWEMTVQALR